MRTGPKAVYYSTTDLFLILGKGGDPGDGRTPLFGLYKDERPGYTWYTFIASLSEKENASLSELIVKTFLIFPKGTSDRVSYPLL